MVPFDLYVIKCDGQPTRQLEVESYLMTETGLIRQIMPRIILDRKFNAKTALFLLT